jgi:hypothetical protein
VIYLRPSSTHNLTRTWIGPCVAVKKNSPYGSHITVLSDSNPLTYLTSNVPKSAKLTRWALALQPFNISFKYTRGTDNVVADFLSRHIRCFYEYFVCGILKVDWCF